MNAKTFPVVGKYRLGWFMVLALVVLFVYGLVSGLTDSISRLSPTWLIPFSLLATASGWCLGGVKRKNGLYFSVGILIGVCLLILIQAEIYLDFYRALMEALRIQVFSRHPNLYLPDAGPLLYHLYTAINNLRNYSTQFLIWFVQMISDQAGFNIDAAYLIWGSLLWIVSFAMGWFVRRKKHAFLASLPALSLLVGVIGFTRRDTTGLIIALSALLGIVVLMEHLQRELRWESQNIDYSEELRFDIISVTVPIIALIMITASLIPRISLERIRAFFDPQTRISTVRRIDFSESLGLEQVPFDPIAGPARAGMPRSHLIGSGPELSDIKIMEIDTGEIYLPPQVDPLAQLPKYYWFSRSYELYSGSGWMTGEIRQEKIPAQQEIHRVELPGYRPVLHTISKTSTAPPTLYFSGILNAVNQDITVAWRETTEEFFAAQLEATEYQVSAYVFDFTVDLLNQSEGTPSEIILDTYLQLPPELPNRVLELATTLTEQETTPYEKAKSIEIYLRQFEYSLDLPEPPEDRDLVDYFLFDLQMGYCDYYASAMVVMARAVQLPARLAMGYTTGTYDYTRQVFMVTEANAHAWPEIYIEPIGWVPFEPTASLSADLWAAETDEVHAPVEPIPLSDTLTDEQQLTWQDFMGLAFLVLLIILIGFLWWFIFRRKQKSTSPTEQIETIYQKMRDHLTRVFFTLQTEHTPLEFNEVYTDFLQQITRPKSTQPLTGHLIEYLQIITNLYEKGVYASQNLLPDQLKMARSTLLKLMVRSLQLKAALIFRKS